MIPIKFKIIFFLLLLNLNSFCQTKYDSLFINQIINKELKLVDKKLKRPYHIFEKSVDRDPTYFNDSIHFYFIGREKNWQDFGINSKYSLFTDNIDIDTCFIIYTPIFNKKLNQFEIKFEIRYDKNFSRFCKDSYVKKRKKWSYVNSSKFVTY